MTEFENYHYPCDWKYTIDDKLYIKIGAYGIDDYMVEYNQNTDKYDILDESNTVLYTFNSLEEAYMDLNEKWQKHEDQLTV